MDSIDDAFFSALHSVSAPCEIRAHREEQNLSTQIEFYGTGLNCMVLADYLVANIILSSISDDNLDMATGLVEIHASNVRNFIREKMEERRCDK